ncbi:hypothetical protein RB195_011218 [Necator americanus]|uniref:Reverse transcriptase domain-containing protein n=1 Tax=Necator americanus TaxID=51031 RepID=A0ABR1D1F9_NECAM
MPLCLTFFDFWKAFDTVETEAVMEAFDIHGLPTQYIKRGVRQRDTISPKIFSATLENALRGLECDNMGVEADGRHLPHLCFADEIVLITSSTNQAEPMLAKFDETSRRIGLQLNLVKRMFMRNGRVSDASFTPNRKNISECSRSSVGQEETAARGAQKSIENIVKRTKNIRLDAHPFKPLLFLV